MPTEDSTRPGEDARTRVLDYWMEVLCNGPGIVRMPPELSQALAAADPDHDLYKRVIAHLAQVEREVRALYDDARAVVVELDKCAP